MAIKAFHPNPCTPVVPGPIQAVGTFLYQLDTAPRSLKTNLWSGGLAPNNGYEAIHVERAVKLMLAAQDLLDALETAKAGLAWYQDMFPNVVSGCDDEAMAIIDAAIAKATKP